LENSIIHQLELLFEHWTGRKPEDTKLIPASGSYRKYFRMNGCGKSAIGAYYDNPPENDAFINLSKHFLSQGLHVPEIYRVGNDHKIYLMQDLGDSVLFEHITEIRQKSGFGSELMTIYKMVIDELIRFQMIAGKTVDFSVCFPSAEFDGQSYMWDLNYFKYNFLKLAKITFDEYKLEENFRNLVQILLSADNSYFVYRDFQARNIMLHNHKLYFIDYQGGRKGTLHYDLISLLFQARAEIPHDAREQLIDYYIEQAKIIDPKGVENFRFYFYKFALVRILQTLGAYGFRGLYEKKQHFLESIPKAIENIKWLLENNKISSELHELINCLQIMTESTEVRQLITPPLTLQISSFSYKRGLPADLTGNGGGFVFDCRGLPNPGRYPKFRSLTGKDPEVVDYFSQYDEVDDFIGHCFALVKQSIDAYIKRSFTNLSVSFGCTGGQHRSVYCAEKIASMFGGNADIQLNIRHLEQE
jgi:aminoglycoside/choline kinase family phosphotransferase